MITGASSGIGRALALHLGRNQARLILASRSAEKLAGLEAELRALDIEVFVVPADLTQPADRERLFREAEQRFGGIDILINNAGIAAHGHFIDLTSEILRQVMELNFFATAEMCRLAIPMLTNGNQPMIVNISSMAGRRGVPAWTEYSASKFAVCGFSEALRAELARFEIDLMLVIPGLTKTDLGANLLARLGRLPADFKNGMLPAQVAERIVAGMEKNKSELRIERQARLLLLLNWLMPRFIDWRMKRVVQALYKQEISDLHSQRSKQPSASSISREAANNQRSVMASR